MQKIIYIQPYQGRDVGETESVPNNVAHGLIEKNIARLLGIYRESLERPLMDKMMKTRGRKKYKVK